ncbi:hypothetical protein [Streptomyces sp. NPDC014733]|uniref:hypothetical protein n=1 Tax=Streptomyces sp. NPDC014733 TaxID=3364885 RepID=UPI003700897E
MADESGVHDGDPLMGGDRGDQLGRGRGVLRRTDVEAQRAQIAFERRPGDRRTGEDGGRQTNSLLES